MLLGSSEEPTMNEWPQRMVGEQRSMLMMPGTNNTNNSTTSSSSGGGGAAAMERPPPQGGGAGGHQKPLKCPRCDSSNTKFCYYNNYSLSQPRHFCKACKRYWTRGGTLRNVPVGGGCRKNKRAKKNPSSSNTSAVAGAATTSTSVLAPPQNINSSGQMNTDMNPFFYDLTGLTGYHTLRHPTSACGIQNGGIYDLQPQMMNALGLGYSQNQHHNNNHEFQSTAYSANTAQFQQPALLQDHPLFGSAASLLVSSFRQTKKADEYPSSLLEHYDDMQGSAGRNVEVRDQQVKLEGDHFDVNGNWQLSWDNTFDAAASTGPSDSSFMYWNPVASSGWTDANNCVPSIAPLI